VTKNGRPAIRIASASTAPNLTAIITEGLVRAPERSRYLPAKPVKPKGTGKSAAEYVSEGRPLSLYLDTSALLRLPVD
jgi:hypothetical protein